MSDLRDRLRPYVGVPVPSNRWHPVPLAERLASRIDYRGDDECWLWKASTRNGYGQIPVDGHLWYVHRLVYELEVGPIPDGFQLDHLCHNRDSTCPGGIACWHRPCANPVHLEAVTQQVNIARAQRTHCRRGHEFTPENTRERRNRKGRICRQCERLWWR